MNTALLLLIIVLLMAILIWFGMSTRGQAQKLLGAEHDKVNLIQQVETLSQDLETLKQRYEQLREENQHSERVKSGLDAEVAMLNKHHQALELSVKEKDALLLDLSDQRSALKRASEINQNTLATLSQEHDELRKEAQRLHGENISLKSEHVMFQERLQTQREEIIELQKKAHLQFEKLANDILDEKTLKFTQANKLSLETLLKPLNESIEGFKQKVELTFTEETKQRSALQTQVRELMEQTNKVSLEANNLASALKGQSKTRGNWGEMILESILQQSGLTKGREYEVQAAIKDTDTGRTLMPDILVNLPDKRTIIIDSKVSLIDFERLHHASDKDVQERCVKDFLRHVRQHVDDLAAKKYDSHIQMALDFTMMFVPIEPAYILAIQEDPNLWSYAYSKRIILISPTNLIACLKLMSDIWRRADQNLIAGKIVQQGERLYDKFVGFVENLEDVGKHITKTQDAYQSALKQLHTGRGNLISQALKLNEMGLNSRKTLPESMLGDHLLDEPDLSS